jgi:CRP-like cAMP-binding protein
MGSSPIKALARENRLLATLTPGNIERIEPHLTPVTLELGTVLHPPEEPIKHLYFPVNAVISMLHLLKDGESAEVALTGREGVTGLNGYLGDGTTSVQALVQIGGEALKMGIEDVRNEFNECGDFQKILLRYAQYMLVQISQTAVCNRLHAVEQQFSRWMLINDDVHRGRELRMTHELVANMLGVSRVSVSVTASKFQKCGLINYSRGVIRITDRPGLEDVACECYEATVSHYDSALRPYPDPVKTVEIPG